MDTHVKIISTTLALLAGIVTASCGGDNVPDDTRSDKMKAALTALDESLAVNSPHAPEMIRHGLENATDSLDYYDWLLRYLRYRVLRGGPDTSFTHWRQAYGYLLKQEQTPRVNGMMAFLFNTQGSYYQKLHYKPEKAIKAFENAYEKLIDSDCKHKMPDVCANLGDAYVFANDMPHAAMWYRRALFIADSLRLPAKDDVTLYMGLGRIYLNLQDFDSALNCYKRADKSFSLMSVNMQLYFLTNYGNYYYYAKDYKKAEAVFRRQEKLLAKNGMQDSYEMYICELNMADVLLNLGQTAEATRLLDRADAYFNKIGDATAIYYCNTIRIGLALKEGNTAKAKSILDKETPPATIDFNLVNIRHRYLLEYFVRKGDYKKAYITLEDNVRRNDSLKHNIANMRASEIMMRYSQDSLRLHSKMLLQEKDAHIRTAYLWLYVAVAFRHNVLQEAQVEDVHATDAHAARQRTFAHIAALHIQRAEQPHSKHQRLRRRGTDDPREADKGQPQHDGQILRVDEGGTRLRGILHQRGTAYHRRRLHIRGECTVGRRTGGDNGAVDVHTNTRGKLHKTRTEKPQGRQTDLCGHNKRGN